MLIASFVRRLWLLIGSTIDRIIHMKLPILLRERIQNIFVNIYKKHNLILYCQNENKYGTFILD